MFYWGKRGQYQVLLLPNMVEDRFISKLIEEFKIKDGKREEPYRNCRTVIKCKQGNISPKVIEFN